MSNLDDGHYGQETLNYEDMNDDHFFEDMGFSLDDLAMLLTPRDGAPSTLTSPFLVSPQGSAAQKQKKTKTFTFDEVDDNKNSTFTPYLKVHQQQTKLDTGLAATTLQIPIDVDDKSIAMGPPQAFYSAANNNSYSNYHPIPTLNSSNTSTNNTVSSHTELSGTAINGYVPQPAGETRGKKNSLKKMEQIAAPMPYQSNFAQIYSNTAWENTDMKLPSLASKNFAMNSDSSAYYQDASLILNNYGNFSNNSANIGSNYRNQIDDASMDNSALPFDQLSGKSYTEGSGKSSLMDFEFDSSGPIEHRMYHLNSQGSEALVEYDITESMKDKIEKNRVSSELFNGDSGKGIVENPPGNEIVKQEQSLDAVKDELSRASKSLAAISRRFVEHYGDKDTIKYLSGGIDCDEPPGVGR